MSKAQRNPNHQVSSGGLLSGECGIRSAESRKGQRRDAPATLGPPSRSALWRGSLLPWPSNASVVSVSEVACRAVARFYERRLGNSGFLGVFYFLSNHANHAK